MSHSPPEPLSQEYAFFVLSLHKLRVNQLKDVCKSVGLAVSGRRHELLDRIIQVFRASAGQRAEMLALETIVLKLAHAEAIPSYYHLVNSIKRGVVSPQQVQDSIDMYLQTPLLAAERNRALNGSHPAPIARGTSAAVHQPPAYLGPMLLFANTLFYSLRHAVGHVHVLPASKGRFTNQFSVTLNERETAALRRGPNMKLYMFAGLESSPDPANADISFPPIEIYVDGVLTKQYLRGIKGKPGTARPADLTPYLQKLVQSFHTKIVYSDANERYLLYLYVVEEFSPETLVEMIAGKQHLPAQSTRLMIKKYNEVDNEDDLVVATSTLSLRCPITYARLKYPMKSLQCSHIQCFDGLSFLIMQQRIPAWQCPVCSSTISGRALVISDYLTEILESTSDNVDSVTLNEDGSWTAVEGDGDDEPDSPTAKPENESAAPEASIEVISLDSDSDDEQSAPITANQPAASPILATSAVQHPASACITESRSPQPHVSENSSDDETIPLAARRARTIAQTPESTAGLARDEVLQGNISQSNETHLQDSLNIAESAETSSLIRAKQINGASSSNIDLLIRGIIQESTPSEDVSMNGEDTSAAIADLTLNNVENKSSSPLQEPPNTRDQPIVKNANETVSTESANPTQLLDGTPNLSELVNGGENSGEAGLSVPGVDSRATDSMNVSNVDINSAEVTHTQAQKISTQVRDEGSHLKSIRPQIVLEAQAKLHSPAPSSAKDTNSHPIGAQPMKEVGGRRDPDVISLGREMSVNLARQSPKPAKKPSLQSVGSVINSIHEQVSRSNSPALVPPPQNDLLYGISRSTPDSAGHDAKRPRLQQTSPQTAAAHFSTLSFPNPNAFRSDARGSQAPLSSINYPNSVNKENSNSHMRDNSREIFQAIQTPASMSRSISVDRTLSLDNQRTVANDVPIAPAYLNYVQSRQDYGERSERRVYQNPPPFPLPRMEQEERENRLTLGQNPTEVDQFVERHRQTDALSSRRIYDSAMMERKLKEYQKIILSSLQMLHAYNSTINGSLPRPAPQPLGVRDSRSYRDLTHNTVYEQMRRRPTDALQIAHGIQTASALSSQFLRPSAYSIASPSHDPRDLNVSTIPAPSLNGATGIQNSDPGPQVLDKPSPLFTTTSASNTPQSAMSPREDPQRIQATSAVVPRFSRSAFDGLGLEGPKVKGILDIEITEAAFKIGRDISPTHPETEAPATSMPVVPTAQLPRAPVSDSEPSMELLRVGEPFDESSLFVGNQDEDSALPLDNMIQDMVIRTPAGKQRAESGDERTWSKRGSKTKFDPSEINESQIIDLDDE